MPPPASDTIIKVRSKVFDAIRKSMKKKKYDSIFEIEKEKDTQLKLTADSSSMGFAVYLKKEFNSL